MRTAQGARCLRTATSSARRTGSPPGSCTRWRMPNRPRWGGVGSLWRAGRAGLPRRRRRGRGCPVSAARCASASYSPAAGPRRRRGRRLRPVDDVGAYRDVPLGGVLGEPPRAVRALNLAIIVPGRCGWRHGLIAAAGTARGDKLLVFAPPFIWLRLLLLSLQCRQLSLLLLLQPLRCGEARPPAKPLGFGIEHLARRLRRLAVQTLRPGVPQAATYLLVLVDAVRIEIAATMNAPHAAILHDMWVELALATPDMAAPAAIGKRPRGICPSAGAGAVAAATAAASGFLAPASLRAFPDVLREIQL
mmetsp:Transcript_84582/g.244428  ORF Transcript_84582/g.244428 Transcript_84582/m.244428 type:complete len:305 (+) Transcript_84582:466-1380(+)